MLRVWLDHAKWIDLSRAANGHPKGAPYVDALEVARAAVASGQVSFVLDSSRYFELHRRREAASRHRLASVMYELSRLHTLASPPAIVRSEIRKAFHDLFGVPEAEPTFTKLFGVGAMFAFGQPDYEYRIPDEMRDELLATMPGYVADFERSATWAMEAALLFGPGDEMSEEGRRLLDEHPFGRRYIEGERERARKFDENGGRKGRLFRDVMSATELVDILEPVNEVALEIGVDLHAAFNSREVLDAFIEAVPSRVVARALRSGRMRNRDNKWKDNDLEDIASLSFAIPYCDVVITEKSWVHHATLESLDGRYGTRIVHDVAELPKIIVEASMTT